MGKSLYQEDIVLWSAAQARALRQAGTAQLNVPTPIDWENVAEEIESLGRSERSALRSRIGVILEHLMKLTASPRKAPRQGWLETILAQRVEIDRLLADSPSLRQEVARLIAEETPRARKSVADNLALYRETPMAELNQLIYTPEQVLGDWLLTPPRSRPNT
jgi:hypothetical protein